MTTKRSIVIGMAAVAAAVGVFAVANAVDEKALVGTWNGKAADGTVMQLVLNADKTCVFTVTMDKESTVDKGTWRVEAELLVMTMKDDKGEESVRKLDMKLTGDTLVISKGGKDPITFTRGAATTSGPSSKPAVSVKG